MALQIERVKTYIRHFDDSLQGGIPKGHIVLLTGTPGTMKSSVAYSMLYKNALKNGTKSIYMTLEQSRENLIQQMATMNMDPEQVKEHVEILDLGLIRKNLKELNAKGTWIQLFKMYAENLKKSLGYEILVVDSLNVLDMAAKMDDHRTEMFYLFEWLRSLDITTFLITEKNPENMFDDGTDAAYLADGIISLRLKEIGETDVQRRIRAVKMRSTDHKTGSFSLLFADGNFSATQVIAE